MVHGKQWYWLIGTMVKLQSTALKKDGTVVNLVTKTFDILSE